MTKYQKYMQELAKKSQQQALGEVEAGILSSYTQVAILQIENDKLEESDVILSALEAAGVDNWEGYDVAIDIRKELENDNSN